MEQGKIPQAEPRPQEANYAQALAEKPRTAGPYGLSIDLCKEAFQMRSHIYKEHLQNNRYPEAAIQRKYMDDLQRSMRLLRCANDNAAPRLHET